MAACLLPRSFAACTIVATCARAPDYLCRLVGVHVKVRRELKYLVRTFVHPMHHQHLYRYELLIM